MYKYHGRTINTVDFHEYGMPYKMPTTVTNTDVTLSIILSEDLMEKIFFEDWVDNIVGDYRKKDFTGTNQGKYDLNFYDDYVGTITINHYDETGKKRYECTLNECYPSSIGQIERSWENKNILKLQVGITYRSYSEKTNENG